ncbi:MAG: UDP-N-acetylglucosamine--N-acetylmuramyl-(pentapeptide) pyrophosphoryl-undecaprenol N-acetylglucosamine transferase [Actinomycetota bacterium]|nr:UDP-N-acetylglucosamine--N-acetylmuramyl-(pentapeptide) pyrophosphoryl-undecaprenol N-acetylglucosamine transferase [Actinomycetota bacterium]
MRALLAGGGSAGHVAPMLALADCLRRRDPATTVRCLGTSDGLEARLVPARGYELALVPRVPFPRRPGADLARLPARLASAVRAAGEAIGEIDAEVVVGFGGYVATPAYLAARRRGVPIVVHEANTRPGLANRVGARLTPYVATTFPGTPLPHARRTGLPLRREITTLDRAGLRPEALETFGLDPHLTTLLVFGGSLGAQHLNETFQQAAPTLAAASVQVLHVSGVGKEFPSPRFAGGPPYVVVPYLDRMELGFAVADAVACRSGAGTVSEVTALGLPTAYVPLPVGNGEQRHNAAPVVAAGGGVLVDDAAATPAWVRDVLVPLLTDRARLAAMGQAAARFGRRDADERLADLVTEAASVATRRRRTHIRQAGQAS